MTSSVPSRFIYKICPESLWRAAESASVFRGAPIDIADGFIHFSTAEQAVETAAKHFAGQDNLLLVRVDSGKLGDRLKWEPSRGGALFPHLYGDLELTAVTKVDKLALGSDGRHQFPPLTWTYLNTIGKAGGNQTAGSAVNTAVQQSRYPMPANPPIWASIHPSVFHNSAGPLRSAEATPRPSGAMRYQCPVNGSLVLVTDEATLADLDRPRARLRCIDCGEMHLLTQKIDKDIDSDVTIPLPAAIAGSQSAL